MVMVWVRWSVRVKVRVIMRLQVVWRGVVCLGCDDGEVKVE